MNAGVLSAGPQRSSILRISEGGMGRAGAQNLQADVFQNRGMLPHIAKRISRKPRRRRRRGDADTRKRAIAHAPNAANRRGTVRERQRERRLRRVDHGPVRAELPVEEPRMRAGRADQLDVRQVAHVLPEDPGDRAPQHGAALGLLGVVRRGAGPQPRPRRVRLRRGRVGVHDGEAVRRARRLQHGRHGHQHDVVRRRDPARPVLDRHVVGLERVRDLGAHRRSELDGQVQVHERRAHGRVGRLGRRGVARVVREKRGEVQRGHVANDALLRHDLLPGLQPDTDRPPGVPRALDQDVIDRRARAHDRAVVALHGLHEGVDNARGAADGVLQHGVGVG